jgi:hypothetical protein
MPLQRLWAARRLPRGVDRNAVQMAQRIHVYFTIPIDQAARFSSGSGYTATSNTIAAATRSRPGCSRRCPKVKTSRPRCSGVWSFRYIRNIQRFSKIEVLPMRR